MANTRFTRNLSRFFPALAAAEPDGLAVEADSVAALVRELERRFPGLAAYLIEDDGRLRKHVNIFVDGESVYDRDALSDRVGPDTKIYIAQALSGG